MSMTRWLIILFILSATHSYGAQIVVHPSAEAIQMAIDSAKEGDEIIVSPGDYHENIVLNGKNFILRSTDPTSATVVATTIIDGDASNTVVTFSGSENTSFTLAGFTITNGYTDYRRKSGNGAGISGNLTSATIRNCVISKNHSDEDCGGGIADCRGNISNCRISENVCEWEGGGLYKCAFVTNCDITSNTASEFGGGGLAYCDIVSNCRISGNYATNQGGGLSRCGIVSDCRILRNIVIFDGGGLFYCNTIDNCEITSNSAVNDEGNGGGLESCKSISNSLIAGNYAGWWGGGIIGSGNLTNCLVTNNISGGGGGGLCLCTGTIANCIISNNLNFGDQNEPGGGLYDCKADITNCTIINNVSERDSFAGSRGGYGGGLSKCSGKIRNCIIWGNIADVDNDQIHLTSTPSFSCIQDWPTSGTGNTSQAPLIAQDGIHLRPNSPCIDTGCSVTFAVDYDNESRPADGDGKGKGTTGDGSDFDIGADEVVLYLTISASAGNGGTISPSGDMAVAFGEDKSFTIQARKGYEIDKVIVDGISVGTVGIYKFSNVIKNHTIQANFRSITAADLGWLEYE